MVGSNQKVVTAYIAKYKLHHSTPVDVRILLDLYDVRQFSFSENTLGFCFEEVIGINVLLRPYEQRMVLAHEIAHKILGHPSSFPLCQNDRGAYARMEREAQMGAAMILIPLEPLLALTADGYSLQQLQQYFEVPAELIRIRLGGDRHAIWSSLVSLS